MNPLSPNTPPAFFRIFSTADPFSFFMSCWLPVTGSETNVIFPWRFVTIREPCPVVLYFPAHRLLSPSQDQQGHSVPSTSAIAPLVASAASSSAGRPSSVAFSTNGVRKVMYRDIVDWATPKMSAHTSSMMFCRRYPQVTTIASREVSSRGRPSFLSHGSSSSSATRYSSSLSCFSSSPDIRSNRNGFSVVERCVCGNLLSIDRRSRCLLSSTACRQVSQYFGKEFPVAHPARFCITLKGYQGSGYITPIKKLQYRELLKWEKEFNADVSRLRTPVERAIAHIKSWRILHTDYRRPLRTYLTSFRVAIGLYFFKLAYE